MVPVFDKALFWDTNPDALDFEKNARWIIARVLQYGDLNDFRKLVDFYGWDRIKNEMLQVRYLDKLTLNLLSVLFKIPKEQFRCYTWQQSNPAPFPY